jgi:hypothetical protein
MSHTRCKTFETKIDETDNVIPTYQNKKTISYEKAVFNELDIIFIAVIKDIIFNYFTHASLIGNIEHTIGSKYMSIDHISVGCGKIFITDHKRRYVRVYNEDNAKYNRKWFINKHYKKYESLFISPICTAINEEQKEIYICDNNTIYDYRCAKCSIKIYNILNGTKINDNSGNFVREVKIGQVNPSNVIINMIVVANKIYIQYSREINIYVLNSGTGELLYQFNFISTMNLDKICALNLSHIMKHDKGFCIVASSYLGHGNTIEIFDENEKPMGINLNKFKYFVQSVYQNEVSRIKSSLNQTSEIYTLENTSDGVTANFTRVAIYDIKGECIHKWDLAPLEYIHNKPFHPGAVSVKVFNNKAYVVSDLRQFVQIYG